MWHVGAIALGIFAVGTDAYAIDVCKMGCLFDEIDTALDSIPVDGVDTITVIDGETYSVKIEPMNDNVTVTIITTMGATISSANNDQIHANNNSDITVDGFTLTTTGDDRCAQVSDTSTLTLQNMVVEGCSKGANGAGLRVNGADASAYIYDSTFRNNDQTAGNRDGGHIWTSGTLYVENTLFNDGTSGQDGGGIAVSGAPTVTLVDVTFRDNDASDNGGAYYAPGGPTTHFTNVVFERAVATGALAIDGGAVYQSGGSLTIVGGSWVDMEASSEGGALYLDGVTAALDNVTITDAIADLGQRGAGIYASGTDLTITASAGPGSSRFSASLYALSDQAVGFFRREELVAHG